MSHTYLHTEVMRGWGSAVAQVAWRSVPNGHGSIHLPLPPALLVSSSRCLHATMKSLVLFLALCASCAHGRGLLAAGPAFPSPFPLFGQPKLTTEQVSRWMAD